MNWKTAVKIAPHDAGAQADIIIRYYTRQYLPNKPPALPPPYNDLAEELWKRGYLSSGIVKQILKCSHPTARKRLLELRRLLGLEGTGQRSRTKFSWYFVSLSELFIASLPEPGDQPQAGRRG